MRLLLDQNLSFRLVEELQAVFPGSMHVRSAGLSSASDEAIWSFARREGLTIVSKDSDFNQMSFLYGAPPEVLWIRAGNCTTQQASALLRASRIVIADFVSSAEEALLLLG